MTNKNVQTLLETPWTQLCCLYCGWYKRNHTCACGHILCPDWVEWRTQTCGIMSSTGKSQRRATEPDRKFTSFDSCLCKTQDHEYSTTEFERIHKFWLLPVKDIISQVCVLHLLNQDTRHGHEHVCGFDCIAYSRGDTIVFTGFPTKFEQKSCKQYRILVMGHF